MATTVQEIIDQTPEIHKAAFQKLHKTILENLPEGFEADISYGSLGYVVPHSIYPQGYHCKPIEPLPFAGIASRKQGIHFYHMGIYSHPPLLQWFKEEYPKHSSQKLDMGKSCIRFKKVDQIPYDLIGELMRKMSVQEWITIYELILRKEK